MDFTGINLTLSRGTGVKAVANLSQREARVHSRV